MIVLTHLNGPTFALNADLIERIEATPDTVVTLIGGTKYVVAESVDELVDRVRNYRGRVIASAHEFETTPAAFETTPAADPPLRLIPRRDRD